MADIIYLDFLHSKCFVLPPLFPQTGSPHSVTLRAPVWVSPHRKSLSFLICHTVSASDEK